MSKQHPESGSGSGKPAAGKSTPAAKRSPSSAKTMEPQVASVDGAAPRPRGRPSIGKLAQVRMTDTERELATELGDGQLAKGVRNALNLLALEQSSTQGGLNELRMLLEVLQQVAKEEGMRHLGGDTMLTYIRRLRADQAVMDAISAHKERQKSLNLVPLSPKDADIATELGEGDAALGLRIALGAARFLGYETARKLNTD